MADDDKASFAQLFEQESNTLARARPLEVGDKVEGLVVHVGDDSVFVELDANRQGYFESVELRDSEGRLAVAAGDRVEGHVLSIERGQVRLGRAFGRDVSAEHLHAACEGRVPVEGKVTGVNKGGLEVEVAGVSAFCPVSQIADRYVEDPSEFVGQSLQFLVVEIRDRGAVLSRRQLLREHSEAQREAVLDRLSEGAAITGRVTRVKGFGAFVDLGGVEGLIPSRELSHDRVRAEDAVTEGDVVEVRVQKIERGDPARITLSLKALAPDPWDGIDTLAPVGHVVAGQVSRLADFGAFVRLGPAVDGLLHISHLGAGVAHPSEVLEIGQQILAVVESVDRTRRRVSLAPAQDDAVAGQAGANVRVVVGATVTAVVEQIERFGVFVRVGGIRGRAGRGLIPNAELGVDRGVDVRKAFPVGTEVQAKVLESGEGKTRLSIRAAKEDAERAVYDGYRQDKAPPKSMGTLGELLQKKLER